MTPNFNPTFFPFLQKCLITNNTLNYHQSFHKKHHFIIYFLKNLFRHFNLQNILNLNLNFFLIFA